MANPLLALEVAPLDIAPATNALAAGLQQRFENQRKNVLEDIVRRAGRSRRLPRRRRHRI
jgi:hypothetical protein